MEFRRMDWIVGGWIAMMITSMTYNALGPQSVPLEYAFVFGLYALGVVIAAYDARLQFILAVTTVAGFVELAADYWLVHGVDVLQYPLVISGLGASPLYMPFGWALVAAQLGYLAVRLDETYGRRIAMLVPGIVAMVGIGYYESLARLIGLWEYVLAPFAMVARVPIFIALGEGLMFALLIYILDRDDPVLAGIGFGVVIFISYGLAYTGLWALALLTTL